MIQGIVVDRDFQSVYENIQEERNLQVEYEMSLPVTSRNRDDMMKEVLHPLDLGEISLLLLA